MLSSLQVLTMRWRHIIKRIHTILQHSTTRQQALALNTTPPCQTPTPPTTSPVVYNNSLLLNPLCGAVVIMRLLLIAVVTTVFGGLHAVKNKKLPISDSKSWFIVACLQVTSTLTAFSFLDGSIWNILRGILFVISKREVMIKI